MCGNPPKSGSRVAIEAIMDSFHQLRKLTRRGGFTFTEVLVAMGILIIFSGTALTALIEYNRYAYVSRLRLHAQALAQQRIDEVLSSNWNIGVTADRHTNISAGTKPPETLVMNADAFNSQAALKSNFTSLAAPVSCTRVTQITDLSTRLMRATVTVTFTYAKKTYTVSLSTIRSSDNF